MAAASAPRCRRRLSAYALSVAAAVLLAACASAPVTVTVNNTVAPPSPESPLPTTDSGIHLGLAFDYSMTTAPAAGKVDYIWGGKESHIGWGIYSEVYIPYDREPNPPLGLAYWQAAHPDWIVYKNDRTTVAYEFGGANVPLDISNPAVRAYQAAWVEDQFALGYRGVAWDNMGHRNRWGRAGVWRNGQWVQLYSGALNDTAYQDIEVNWAHAMYDLLKAAAPDRNITFNLASAADPAWIARLIPWFDVWFDEEGFTSEGEFRWTGSLWNGKQQICAAVNAAGKAFVMNGSTAAANDAAVSAGDVEWILANYLIVKGSHSYTNVYAASPGYGHFYDRPEFSITIGSPTGTATADGNGIWSRLFTGGRVYSNPTTTSRSITLPAGYANLHGGAVGTSVTLPAATARIFLTVPG